MIFHPALHYVFDAAAYATSALIFRAQLRGATPLSPALGRRAYWLCLTLGAVAGAYLFGSWNLFEGGRFQLGHSVAGAIAGGILGAELFKWRMGIRGSTGAVFVLSLSFGIAVGRLGCFFAGLPDQTYGIPASLPWAVDFGDGIRRHPVQLYECLSLLFFAGAALLFQRRHAHAYARFAFHAFVLYYACQRFVWEFLKPYPLRWGGWNLFHFLCAALAAYAALMIAMGYAQSRSRA